MKRLQTLQNHIVLSNLVEHSQLSLHIANLKPYYDDESEENALILHYQVALFIKDYTRDLAEISLVLSLALSEIWQAQCNEATLETLETDPLDSQGFTIAAVINCQESFHLHTDNPDIDLPEGTMKLNINGEDKILWQEEPIIGTSLPWFKAIKNTNNIADTNSDES